MLHILLPFLFFTHQPTAASIESFVIIDAPAQKVWAVLENLEDYDQWNTFTPKIESDKIVGNDVILHVAWKVGQEPMLQTEQLMTWAPGEKLEWGIQDRGFLKTVRIQTVEDLGDGTSKYYTRDDFWGVGTGFVMLFYKKKVQAGFDRVGADLKRYVEGK
ncbi:MAG: SRPBCC domain-containing protein [Bacteroidota bacterium]